MAGAYIALQGERIPMNKNKYTHVFWDWNGTIIDDLEINFSVINTLLSIRKKDIISLFQYRQAFTFPIKEFYGRVGLPINDEQYEKLVSDYWALYKSKAKDIPLMIGVLDVLNMLRKNQIKQYVLSASDKKMVFDQMSIYGIRELFEDVIAPQDGYAFGKIELAKQWMSKQNISPSDILMIGDTLHDFETANAIGIDCALVDMGHQDLNPYINNSKFMVYENINKLVDIVFAF